VTARAANDRRVEAERDSTSLALWFALLGGPLAGFLNVIVTYPTVDRACVNDSSAVLHILTLLFLLMAVAAGVTAWRLRDRIGMRPSTGPGPLPRSYFMATVGMLTAAMAVFGIVLQWIPIFFLGACHGT
jgi:hypothetical protein